MDRFLSVRARNGVAGDPAAFPGVLCYSRCGAFQVGNLRDSVAVCQEGSEKATNTANGVKSSL